MSDKYRYDLIIFTARREEMFFLETFFDHKRDDHYPEVLEVQPIDGFDDLRIGLVNIGEMGNVASAVKAFEVLERILPRSVIMVGLAGGYLPQNETPILSKGDVGIAEKIFYHSYGKVHPSKGIEIRNTLNLNLERMNDISVWINNTLLTDRFFSNNIIKRVSEWWKEDKFKKKDWLETIPKVDQKKYLKQDAPTDPIQVKTVSISSGEVVINDETLIQKIRATRPVENITLFEMESYGIGKVCEKFKIPFLLVKGISDYAGGSETPNGKDGKDDKSRWRAIAAASAVVLELLSSQFREKVMGQTQPTRPGIKNIASCLSPNGKVVCRYPMGNCDYTIRKCINSGLQMQDTSPVWLCRVFEDVNAMIFSQKLTHAVIDIIKNESYIATFFPYSARDLLLMLLALRKTTTTPEKINLLHVNWNSPEQEHIIALKDLVNETRHNFMHFQVFDEVCKEKNINSCEGPPKIARIIILDRFSSDINTIVNDPLSMVFPLLLGSSVPTYFTMTDKLETLDACAPDITFIKHKSSQSDVENDYRGLVTLRFFAKSKTLIVSGLAPCELCAGTSQDISSQFLAVRNLYIAWKGWSGGDNKFHSIFHIFPMQEIKEKYNLE